MKKYYYGSTLITEDEKVPTCKICGSNLLFKKTKRGREKLIGCSNEQCTGFNTKSRNTLILMSFGKEYLEKIKDNKRKSSYISTEYWIKKGLSKEDANAKISAIQKERGKKQHEALRRKERKLTASKEYMLTKLSPQEVKNFMREKSRFCEEYWIKRGYTKEEAKEKIHSIQKENSSKQNLENIKKKSWRCPEYWMIRSGYTKEEATQIISKKQATFSKQLCIKKYGEEEGIKKWKERQNKWQESLHNSKKLHVGFSKVSQELFNALLENYDSESKDYVFYGEKNHEYCLRENDTNYIYDFTDLSKRKIIEFQGDIYHGNPLIFEINDKPNPFKRDKTRGDLWAFDKEKENIANNNGFKVLYVWEKEYKEDKERIIKKCKEFLNI